MSNETMVTIRGWMANDPTVRSANGFNVASFRVGCTPRRFNRARQEWVDAPTQWYAVSAWRELAANCERSLKKGDPVIVHGRLEHRTYVNAAGTEVVSLEIDAITVGHDLTRGFGQFMKSPSRRETAPRDQEPRREQGSEPSEAPVTGPVPSVEEMAVGAVNAA